MNIIDLFEVWKNQPEQRSITNNAEKPHLNEYRTKLQVLKNDFVLLLNDKYKEG